MIAFENAVAGVSHEVIALSCGSQMGKTEALLDMIGWRLDRRPRPQLYVGPSRDFATDQFSPRVTTMVEQSKSLSAKASSKKREKATLKVIAGVPLRLAWAGSATQLKSDSFGDVYVDEIDGMAENVKGEGDPLQMAKARSFTYADRKIVVCSTPLVGIVETEVDEETGLEFWKRGRPEDMQSAIWRLFQSGTMYHWAWPCPHCGRFFIPRFSRLKWPEKSKPVDALEYACIECPNCEQDITDDDKPWMNERGVYVAPGQDVLDDGTVVGDPPRSRNMTFWVSGLASPFVKFGERAAAYVEAVESGKQSEIQAVLNTGFGELFAPGGGDVPEWQEVAACRAPYALRQVPEDVRVIIGAVDVQKNRLPYVVRGFGAGGTSWLVDCGELFGPTEDEEVWDDFADFAFGEFDGAFVRLFGIDSGFRPGKPDIVPVHRVYEFCRRFPTRTRATKDSSTPMRKPIATTNIDILINGQEIKHGLELMRLDTDHWKSWVHERVRWNKDQPGAWFVPDDISEDYCRQIVSEARVRKPSGRVQWVQRSRENHFLDCEAMIAALASSMNLFKLKSTHRRAAVPAVRKQVEEAEAQPETKPKPTPEKPRGQRGGSWLGGGSIWS